MSSKVIQINLFLLSGDGGWTSLWIGLDQSDILYSMHGYGVQHRISVEVEHYNTKTSGNHTAASLCDHMTSGAL